MIGALQLDIAGEAGVLRISYDAARRILLDNAIAFDPAAIGTLCKDFAEIARALTADAQAG